MLSSFYITAPHMATVPTFCLMANTTFSKTQETAGRVSFISMLWSFTLVSVYLWDGGNREPFYWGNASINIILKISPQTTAQAS